MMISGWAVRSAGRRRDRPRRVARRPRSMALDRLENSGPNRFARVAAAFIEAGRSSRASALLTEAIQAMESNGQHWYEAEVTSVAGRDSRQRARRARIAEAEACFENAINVAHSQDARLFELRAAIALSQLQCDPEQRKRRTALLGSIYGRFTEGFEQLISRRRGPYSMNWRKMAIRGAPRAR